MITKEELLTIIYTYYPKNVNTDDVAKHVSTPEYQLRLKACENARLNKEKWLDFKKDIIKRIEDLKGRYADYSVLGSVPAYFLSTYIEDLYKNNNITSIDILISVLSPFWTYRFSSPEHGYRFTFPADQVIGLHLIESIEVLIRKHFAGYTYLPEEFHQIKLEDISSSHKQAPDLTIFDALFVD